MRHHLALAAFVLLVACGSEPASPPLTIGCLAGTVATCTCIGAGDGEGSRTCGPTGRYGLCVCPGSDAGDDDASSADVPEGDALAPDAATGDGPADAAPGDASADATTDAPATDTPALDGGGACYQQESAAPVCPTARVMNDAMRPSFRVTHINITQPAALASPILAGTVNGAVHAGGFLWGISYDLVARSMRTGAFNVTSLARGTVGQGLIDGAFSYYAGDAGGDAPARWDPALTTITVMGDRVSSGTIAGTVRLPIFSGASLLTELPLEAASLVNVQLTTDRGCVGLGQIRGGRFNECTSGWATANDATPPTPYGTIRAVILASAAQSVNVSALNQTLCQLLSGSDCATVPQAMWTRQPDAMVGGMPGYTLIAEFAAISARIR